MKISIKQFTAHICEVLEKVITSGEEIVITKHSKPYVVIKSYNNSLPNVVTLENVKEKIKEIIPKKVPIDNHYFTYGCGCIKEDKSPMCTKHGRV